MIPEQAAEALAKARDLNRRALANYARYHRFTVDCKSSRQAIDCYHRQTKQAEALLDEVARYIAASAREK